MSYCPLCFPQLGVAESETYGGYIIVKFLPLTEFYPDSITTECLEIDTGIHVVTRGVPNVVENIPENRITIQVCHPISDWNIKHFVPYEELTDTNLLIETAIADFIKNQKK